MDVLCADVSYGSESYMNNITQGLSPASRTQTRQQTISFRLVPIDRILVMKQLIPRRFSCLSQSKKDNFLPIYAKKNIHYYSQQAQAGTEVDSESIVKDIPIRKNSTQQVKRSVVDVLGQKKSILHTTPLPQFKQRRREQRSETSNYEVSPPLSSLNRRIKTEHVESPLSPQSRRRYDISKLSSPELGQKEQPRMHPLRNIQKKQTINQMMDMKNQKKRDYEFGKLRKSEIIPQYLIFSRGRKERQSKHMAERVTKHRYSAYQPQKYVRNVYGHE